LQNAFQSAETRDFSKNMQSSCADCATRSGMRHAACSRRKAEGEKRMQPQQDVNKNHRLALRGNEAGNELQKHHLQPPTRAVKMAK